MDKITTGKVYASLIGGLGIIGLFVDGHLFEIMNTDIALDILRIALAAYLVYAAFIAKNEKLTANGLLVVGVLYIGMAIGGMFSSTLGGLLPSGLTEFDIAFHLVMGVAATVVAKRSVKAHNSPANA